MWSPEGQAVAEARELDEATGAECLARLRRGDPDALCRLLESYWHPLVSYAAHLLGEADDAAEDLVQEAFIRLWERRASWTEGSLPAPILYTLVRNLALNAGRNRRTRRLLARLLPFPSATRGTPEDEMESNELGSAIEKAVQALPARRREVFVLARFHGLSYQQIAELMSITPRTVANQMSSALSELRDSLHAFSRDPRGEA